jgi:hypothetical protein
MFILHLVFIDDLEQYSWSMGMYLPKYDGSSNFFVGKAKSENSGNLDRIFCRIVFRTPAAALRSDYNGLDMYTVSFQKIMLVIIQSN